MDFALVTNLLLFLGAMGVTFALDGGSSNRDDEDEDRADTGGTPHLSGHLLEDDDPYGGEDSLAADRDNLAWFLTSGEVAFDELPSNNFAMLPPPQAQAEASDAEPDAEPETAPESDSAQSAAEADDQSVDNPVLGDPVAADIAVPHDATDTGPTATSIELSYLPALDPETGEALVPELSVHPTEDGSGSVVWLDGLEVARFDDLPGLAPEQISLLPEEAPAEGDAEPQDTDDAEEPVRIEAFTPGADQIEIAYHPATDAAGAPLPPDIKVELTEDAEGQAALVLLDGYVVARVMGSGAAQLRPADIVTLPV